MRHGQVARAYALEQNETGLSEKMDFAAPLDVSLYLLAIPCGLLVGFLLGLIGGGGSILAIPLLIYVIGVSDPHLAIGTGSVAVATIALFNLWQHARVGNIKWPCAITFGLAGVAGASVGAHYGKMVDGQYLTLGFAGIMVLVAASMLRSQNFTGDEGVHLTPKIAVKLFPVGLGTGLIAGFFGIGGGFLIVPGLMLGSRMPMMFAVGSSLVSVSLFGLTTSVTYALSGMVLWPVAAAFLVGGAVGSKIGTSLGRRMAGKRGLMVKIFAGIVFLVAIYMVASTLS